MKIIEKFKKKSLIGKVSDLFFIVLVIAMLIPVSRRSIVIFVKKNTITQPNIEEKGNLKQLSSIDYSWKLLSTNNEKITLLDWKNKVIFINFWATWCPSCVAEMSSIQELYDKYEDNPKIEFAMITNQSKKEINAFLHKNKYNFPVFTELSKTPGLFEHKSIPQTFIISKKGQIRVQKTGCAKWHGQKIVNLINELLKE